MPTVLDSPEPITLGTTTAASGMKLYWLSPVIVGLVAPAIGILLLFPSFAVHAGAFIALLLVLALAVAILAYCATIFIPADPVGLEIDKRSRLVTVVMASPFAIKRLMLDFADVATLRFATFYDQDGYSENGAELTTRDGDTIEFSADVTQSDVDAARRALGLRDPAAKLA